MIDKLSMLYRGMHRTYFEAYVVSRPLIQDSVSLHTLSQVSYPKYITKPEDGFNKRVRLIEIYVNNRRSNINLFNSRVTESHNRTSLLNKLCYQSEITQDMKDILWMNPRLGRGETPFNIPEYFLTGVTFSHLYVIHLT